MNAISVILTDLRLMLSTGLIAMFWMISPLLTIIFCLYMLFSSLRVLFICMSCLYGLWFAATTSLPSKGGMAWEFARQNFPPGHWVKNYFSHKLIKSAELSPDRNYIVGSHPHGVLSIGASLTLSFRPTFSQLFPGIETRVLTLSGQFRWPFRREFALVAGAMESSRESLDHLLSEPHKGVAVGIVLGGLAESLASRPRQYLLKIKDRKGFCKAALRHGCDLVPLFHFGENEIYDQITGHDERRFMNMQARMRNVVGFIPPTPMGRSLFGFPWGGLFPYRRQIVSVMGAPIAVEKVEQPTQQQIDQLHAKYCEQLEELFERNKCLYGVAEDSHLVFF